MLGSILIGLLYILMDTIGLIAVIIIVVYAGALYEAAWISMILIIFLLAVNRVTIICIRHTYKQWIANTCKQGRSGIRRNVTSSTERRILIQSIALFSFTTNNVFFDFFSYYLLPNTKWTAFSLNLIRHFCIVMVPILNFIFNLSLRKKALQYTKAAIYRLSGSSPPSITQRALMPTTVPIDAGGITRVNITLY
ncbi:unnamed protein product [Toxocara canis]|uniref:G_PROTEIN_RECEP_F1_2 domain-containing protein n=1 Tax=Toxocara canis TaxID=6265 RepID=A0A183UNR4_TOXCA|nr:unnamed protein product [Toxocara canis]